MILIIKYAGIGDIIMSLPSYYFLCEKHGRSNVYWLVDKKFNKFIEVFVPKENLIFMDFDALHRSFVSKLTLVVSINFLVLKKNFKKVYLFHSNIRYRIFLLTSLMRNRNYCYKFLGRQNIISGRYSGLNFFSMVSEKGGPDLNQFNIYFKKLKSFVQNLINAYDGNFVNAIDSKVRYVLCTPGYGGNIGDQSSERRKLPLDRWKEVVEKCKALGYKVVVTGAPSEVEVLSPISDLVDYNFIGKTNFLDLLFLMRNSSGIISTDNGQFHMATMVNVKVLSIFGPTNFHERLPPANENIFQINKSLPICAPCHDGRLVFECKHNICMTNFNPNTLAKYL